MTFILMKSLTNKKRSVTEQFTKYACDNLSSLRRFGGIFRGKFRLIFTMQRTKAEALMENFYGEEI